MMSNPTLRTEPKPIPAELDRWNWGAFLLNWIWGVGNNTFIALLTLVPFFGILIMPFVLGAKGSKWAWRNGRWGQRRAFQACPTLMGHLGGRDLGRPVLVVCRALWRRFLLPEKFRSLRARGSQASGQR